MVRTYKRKTNRGSIGEDVYEKAAKDVKEGKLSLRKSANIHKVNFMTLQRYMKRKQKHEDGSTAAGKCVGYVRRRQDHPCASMKSSDGESDSVKVSEGSGNVKVNKVVIELNGCEKPNCKSPIPEEESCVSDTSNKKEKEESNGSPAEKSDSSCSTPRKIVDAKTKTKNDTNDDSTADLECMDVDSEDVNETDKAKSEKKVKSPESKTNNDVSEDENDDEAMEVDSAAAKSSNAVKEEKSSKSTKASVECDESPASSSQNVKKRSDTIEEEKSDQLPDSSTDKDESDKENQVKEESSHSEKPEKSSEKGIRGSHKKKSEDKATDKSEAGGKSKASSSSENKSAASSTSESKSEKKKSKKNRTCEECGATKGLKFQVVFQGKTRYLCSDVCCKAFKNKQKAAKSAPEEPKTPAEAENCGYCKKEIKDNKGYYPMVGEVKGLCSEECLLNYQENNSPKKKCSQCKVEIEDDLSCLSWETMEFCNEDCLGKYQSFLGSHCTCCQSPVQQTSLGKYCVCFGADIRQFCSGNCLEEFKKGLKVCSFCQKDLSSGGDGFLAPVGEKGMFKDFCTQQCMERYEIMNFKTSNQQQRQQCSFCNKSGNFKIQTKHEDKPTVLCSENCVAGFRYVHKILQKVCDTCYKFFDVESESEFFLQFEGVNKYYCSKPCMTLFVLSHRTIVPCTWCKVKKYNFDMIEKLDSSNQTQTYCSLNCISLYRVSVNATSAKSIRCDNCSKNLPAQYHLTMSDGSIRNFCTYPCVISFQNQFTTVPTLTTTTPSNRSSSATVSTSVVKATAATGTTPAISSVMSLTTASPRSVAPNLSAKLVPQKLVAAAARQASPSLAIITTKTTTPIQSISTATSSASTGSQFMKEIIVKPPAPKSMKNKAVLCKPIMQTKGVSCKPHPCHKAVQTDESSVPAIIPIPIPIYVPTPVHMFSRPVPCPVPFPVPIPIPIFIPTTKDSPDQIKKQLNDIQDKIPSNPYEAELLMMAEMVAEKSDSKGSTNLCATENFDEAPHIPAIDSTVVNEMALDVEAALPSGIAPMITKEEDPSLETVDDFLAKEERSHGPTKRTASQGRGRGRAKRARVEVDVPPADDLDPFANMPLLEDQNSAAHPDEPDSSVRLKFTFGVNAWKHWVLQKNSQMEKGTQSLKKFKFFKTDLLQLPPDELNYSLCLFVKEVRKPSGEEYAPASIYYLCLGIQQFLFENGRIDNIFTDPYYEKFTDCLNDVLQNQEEIMTTEGYFVSRIEEEVLWESKQLGAHSPHVLLNTLMYFNTKYFSLKTVDDHIHLSFSHITKHWRKTSVKVGPRSVILRYYPPTTKDWQNRKRKEEPTMFEQNENVENPLRCPVKLYEFYLSKCPESVKTRNDVFYLYPERSCVPDSPVWYSTQALGRDMISRMLQRIKTVREIYET